MELGIFRIYSLLCIVSYYAGFFKLCSKSINKLTNSQDITKAEKTAIEEISLNIFKQNKPINPDVKKLECPYKKCNSIVTELDINCKTCGSNYGACVVSGQSIFVKEYYLCKTCRHKSILSEINKLNLKHCALCHSKIILKQ